jgi:hypothetical protein
MSLRVGDPVTCTFGGWPGRIIAVRIPDDGRPVYVVQCLGGGDPLECMDNVLVRETDSRPTRRLVGLE